MNAAVPRLKERLQALLDERAEDVETMHQRTTPWTTFETDPALGLPKRGPGARGKSKGIGKIERVRAGEGEADDLGILAKFEQMADEVVRRCLTRLTKGRAPPGGACQARAPDRPREPQARGRVLE